MACILFFEEKENPRLSKKAALERSARQSVDEVSSIHCNTSSVYSQAYKVVVFEVNSVNQ
jgi:hypothetical protein